MNKKYLIPIIFLFLICISFTNAVINITQPQNNTNIQRYINLTWTDNETKQIPFYNAYLDGTLFNNTLYEKVQITDSTNGHTASSSYQLLSSIGVNTAFSTVDVILSIASGSTGTFIVQMKYADGTEANTTYGPQGGPIGTRFYYTNSYPYKNTTVINMWGKATGGGEISINLGGAGETYVNTTQTRYITNYDLITKNLTIGQHTINITSYNTTNITSKLNYFNLTRNALLTTNIYDRFSNYINNTNIIVYDQTFNFTETYNINGTRDINIIKNHNYTITLNNSGYVINITNYVSTNSSYQTLNFILYPVVAIIITVRDETTLSLIMQNITVTLTDITTPKTYSTTSITGNVTFINLTGGDIYEVRFTTANYSTSRYYRTVVETLYDQLDAYIILNSQSQNFSICFYDINGGIVTNLHLYEYLLSDTVYLLVQDGYTDLNGRIGLVFNPSKYYYYTWNSTLYAISSFILNPPQNSLILADGCNYDITLQYASATIVYNNLNVTGTSSYNNITKIMTVSYTSRDNTLINYSYTVNKIISGLYTTVCSGTSTVYPTQSFTCDLTGYTGDIYIQEVANGNTVFYGTTYNIPGIAKLFDNLEPKDAAYYTGFIMLIIVFAGVFLGLTGTLLAGVLGLFIIGWIGILTPVTTILIVVDIIITGVIAFSLRR